MRFAVITVYISTTYVQVSRYCSHKRDDTVRRGTQEMNNSTAPSPTKRGRGRPPGFRMTDDHKEKIRRAQIRRWAVRKHLADQALNSES